MRDVILIAALVLASPTAILAETYVVNPDGTGDFPTIQAAIDAVVDGDVIELTDGIFTGDGNRDIDYVGKAITVRSQSGDPDSCIIDCQGSETEPRRGISFVSGEGAAAVLDAVTVTNGHAPDGGAILCVDSSPTVSSCILRDCVAGDEGGAVYCEGASPRLEDCSFVENEASERGGAVFCLSSSVTFVGCAFLGNSAGSHGGGVACQSSTGTTVLQCDFLGNCGGNAGGGVDFHDSEGTLTDCVFRGNSAVGGTYGDGGGLYCDNSSPSVSGCSFMENYAGRNGGGLGCRYSADPALAGCTFAGNTAANVGGAIVCATSSNAQLTNCTLWGNSASAGGGIMSAASLPRLDNVIIAFSSQGEAIAGGATLACCDLYGNAGGNWEGEIEWQYGIGGNIAEDPLFCDPENEDFQLRADSPCAPFSPPNEECDLIGAWPVGCEAVPTTYVVTPDGSGDFPTIQAAIDAAIHGDVIELTNGTFTGDGNRDIDFLGKAITVRSQSGDPDSCIIDCQGSEAVPHRGFRFHSGEGAGSVLAELTVTSGYGTVGGAIRCEDGGSPTLMNCIIGENTAQLGGGISCSHCSPVILGCAIRGNTANGGGGIDASYTVGLRIENCIIAENTAVAWEAGGIRLQDDSASTLIACDFSGNTAQGVGGGLWREAGSSASLIDCIFADNTSYGDGGGIYCERGSVTLTGGEIRDNASGGSGAGLFCDRCVVTISETVICGNLASHTGGGVLVSWDASASISDCTLVGNWANSGGGAIAALGCELAIARCTMVSNFADYGGGVYSANGVVSPPIDNTIIAFSLDGGAIRCDLLGTPVLSCSDLYGNVGGDWVGFIADQYGINGNFSADPCFCGMENDDYHLWNYSPCNQEGCGLIGAWPVGCSEPQDARGDLTTSGVPRDLRLAWATPNPFTTRTRISLWGSTPATGQVTLRIYDSTGRFLRVVTPTAEHTGICTWDWDGADARGRCVPSGAYFYRLASDDGSLTGRLLRVE